MTFIRLLRLSVCDCCRSFGASRCMYGRTPASAAWRSGSVVGLDQRGQPTLSPVSTAMGDSVRVRLPVAELYFSRLSLLPSVGR